MDWLNALRNLASTPPPAPPAPPPPPPLLMMNAPTDPNLLMASMFMWSLAIVVIGMILMRVGAYIPSWLFTATIGALAAIAAMDYCHADGIYTCSISGAASAGLAGLWAQGLGALQRVWK